MLHVQDLLGSVAAHDLDRVLIAEVVRAFAVSRACSSRLSPSPTAALIPPAAATECDRTGCTFEINAAVAPASAAASAACCPAKPAPRTSTSCSGTDAAQ
jgi:hypothetical protein